MSHFYRYCPQKVMIKLKSFKWRGFKVTVWNNNAYDFKYEYTIEPLGSSSLRLTKHRGKYHKVITDPTSMKFKRCTIEDAKIKINELRHPGWWKR